MCWSELVVALIISKQLSVANRHINGPKAVAPLSFAVMTSSQLLL